jgi:AAHS family 4-hydroxybenzoate transporter-like MFS transporter
LDQLLKESDTEVGEQKGALRMIWRPEWRRATLGLGLAFLANLAVSYALFGWAPVLLTTLDFPPNLALRGALLLNGFGALAAAIGLVAAQGSAGQQFVLFYTSIGVLAIMLLTTLLLSVTHEQTLASIHWLILVGLTLVGVGTLGSQAGLYGLAAAAYPTDCRSSGIGVAGACGRLGGVLSSLAGGAVLSSTHGPIKFLCALGVCFLLGGIGVSIVSRDRRLAASPP